MSFEERQAIMRAERLRRELLATWEIACPAIYKATDIEMLPDKTASRQVVEWTYNPKGLLLVGPSRVGKTRSAWELVKRACSAGHTTMAFDGLSWFIGVSGALSNLETADDWFDSVCSVDLLFLDDIFRGRMTEAQDVGLWGTIERRMAAGKPCVVTTNATGQTLVDRCGAQIVPIIERLRECCNVVTFKIGAP